MDLKTAKEARSFAITSIVMGSLIVALITAVAMMGKDNDAIGILPIGAGILFAIGFTLLPKANRVIKNLTKFEKDNEDKIN